MKTETRKENNKEIKQERKKKTTQRKKKERKEETMKLAIRSTYVVEYGLSIKANALGLASKNITKWLRESLLRF